MDVQSQESDKQIAVRVSHVSKRYRLGEMGGRTLQHDLQTWWAKRRGKEDPNLRIGATPRLVGEEFWALRDVSLEVMRGERLGIIGVNGAGKSTLLKLLSRITAPTEGEIDIWGRVSSMLEVGTGFHREMTGRENVYMNGAILGMTRAQIDERMASIIEFSEVGDFIDTPVKRYSSGMFVKLAFSVAAHLASEIMIMDEVLAVGDLAFQHKCLDRMRSAADEEGRTVLYVSHNMDTIRRLCNRCIVLDQGRVVYNGDVAKGVAAYMNAGLDAGEVDIDLTDRAHAAQARTSGTRITRILLRDKLEPRYEPMEPLKLRLWIDTESQRQDLLLRLTLRTETDVGVGTAWSQPFDLDGPGTYELDLCMPLDVVQKGRLYASVGLYRSDEVGRKIMADHVTHAFRIELMGVPTWNVQAYGYVTLPSIEVHNVKRG